MAKNKKENRELILTKIIFGIFAIFILHTVFVSLSQHSQAAFEYNSMEKIPGFETEKITDFPILIQTIYKFAMWVVGICALFMITIGGFTYMTSAGNTSTAGTGKKMITDAIIGLILALTAVLLFNVINPSLTTVNLQIAPAGTSTGGGARTGTGGTGAGTGGTGTGTGTGTTAPPTTTSSIQAADKVVRDRLTAAGVSVNRNCSATAPTTCVNGLSDNIVNRLSSLKSVSGCNITITGGTEGSLGGHSSSCHTASSSSCVDIRRDSCVNSYFSNPSSVASQYGISRICADNLDSSFPRSMMAYNCSTVETVSHLHIVF